MDSLGNYPFRAYKILSGDSLPEGYFIPIIIVQSIVPNENPFALESGDSRKSSIISIQFLHDGIEENAVLKYAKKDEVLINAANNFAGYLLDEGIDIQKQVENVIVSNECYYVIDRLGNVSNTLKKITDENWIQTNLKGEI